MKVYYLKNYFLKNVLELNFLTGTKRRGHFFVLPCRIKGVPTLPTHHSKSAPGQLANPIEMYDFPGMVLPESRSLNHHYPGP